MAVTDTAVMGRTQTHKAEGVWAPAVTPFDKDLAPDGARFSAHVRWLLETGCHGVALFGTTGEGTSLTVDERIGLIETVLAAGLPADRLMIGTGCAALPDTVSLTAASVRLGCPDVLMLPPFYYKDVDDDGLYASYAEAIERVGEAALGIYLYHFPKMSAVPIGHAVIERLLKVYPDTIKGVKDSSGDQAHTLSLIEAFPQLAIFAGAEPILLPVLERGGAGCITAGANVNAAAIRGVYDAWKAGDSGATALQERVTAQRGILQSQPMIATLKHVLAAERDDPAWTRVRPPLVSLPAEAGEGVRRELAASGFNMAPV